MDVFAVHLVFKHVLNPRQVTAYVLQSALIILNSVFLIDPPRFLYQKGKQLAAKQKQKGAAALGAKSSFTFWYGKKEGPTRKNNLYLVVPRVMDRPLLSPL